MGTILSLKFSVEMFIEGHNYTSLSLRRSQAEHPIHNSLPLEIRLLLFRMVRSHSTA
jgi:hypothetical protein